MILYIDENSIKKFWKKLFSYEHVSLYINKRGKGLGTMTVDL